VWRLLAFLKGLHDRVKCNYFKLFLKGLKKLCNHHFAFDHGFLLLGLLGLLGVIRVPTF
jgi:hypothetical protein